jgi:hypothetical protein
VIRFPTNILRLNEHFFFFFFNLWNLSKENVSHVSNIYIIFLIMCESHTRDTHIMSERLYIYDA